MAAAAYTSNLIDIYAGAGTTTGMTSIGQGASGLAAETDYFIQGTGCTSKGAFADSAKGIIYDNGAGVTIPTDGAAFIWLTHQTANSLATIANGGLQALVGSATGAYKQYYIGGSDTIIYNDRWLCIPINPTLAASATTGAPTTTRQTFGVISSMVGGPTKGSPLALDAIRYGRGYDYTNGDLANGYANFSSAALKNDLIANRYGLIQLSGTTYTMQGLHRLGTATTAVDFRDANRNIAIANNLFVTTNFNGIEVNNSASNVQLTNITIAALGTVSRGNFLINNNPTVNIIGCTFVDMGTFSFGTNTTVTNVVFSRCGIINSLGAAITDCSFNNSRLASSVVLTNLSDVTNSSFISDGSNHAVELTSLGSGSMNWSNELNGYSSGVSASPVTPTSTGNEAIYVNVASGTLTINITDGASIPSIRSAGATVNVVAGLKTFQFSLNPAITNYEWRLYSVTATGSLEGSVELAGEEVASLSSQNYTYSYSSDIVVAVQIMKLNYVESITYYTLKNEDLSVNINLTIDNNN